MFISASMSLHAEESLCSVNLFGFSWHEDSNQRKTAHQENPGLGLRCNINRVVYVEGNHIWKNSVRGATDTLGVGFHTEISKQGDHSLKIGAQVMRMHYQFPTKRDRSGYVPALTAEYSFTKNVGTTLYLFPDSGRSVALIALNISF